MIRIEYQLALTLAFSIVVLLAALLLKLAILLPQHRQGNTFTVLPAMESPTLSSTSSLLESVANSAILGDKDADVYPQVSGHGNMTREQYRALYKESMENPEAFWTDVARRQLAWSTAFTVAYEAGRGVSSFDGVRWFGDGKLNGCFNAVDRHAAATPDRIAIIWEGDSEPESRKISYAQLLDEVKRVAGMLRESGVRKGDTVTIYMPMVPETAFAMLACARIGAVHNVVFGGFGAEALGDRLRDSGSKVLLTANQGWRGGKAVELKTLVDRAVADCPLVRRIIVLKRTEDRITPLTNGRDVWWHDALPRDVPNIAAVEMGAEDPLFILYTSGSTGRPKALVHTTGGYLVYTSYTYQINFGIAPAKDVFFCTADAGWITGHSYVLYGPLVSGSTSVMFEGVATHPNASRLWRIINRHSVTHLYTAPTLVRMLKRLGDKHIVACPSLRVIGSVGEPIDAKAWLWLYDRIGDSRCSVTDTYWQTETGGHVLAAPAGAWPMKPGAAGPPFFGIEPSIVAAAEPPPSGSDARQSGVLTIKRPWPGMARTVLGDHERFVKTYLSDYPGSYFTGDGASVDSDGDYWVRGRVDDVINVAGHRFSTAEIEGALTRHASVAEAAVLGRPDELTGQSIAAFCLLRPDSAAELGPDRIRDELRHLVRQCIGPIATPKFIFFPPDLPKTRSGKIMRRVLRKLLAGEHDSLGDLSTMTNPQVIDELRSLLQAS